MLVYSLFFSEFLKIEDIEISGNQTLPIENLKSEIENLLSVKYLGFLNKNNYLLITQRGIENTLTEKFKKIKTVAVKKTFPHKLSIAITERQTSLIWCSGNSCYYVDEEGTAWQSVDFNSPEFTENNFIIIIDRSLKPLERGDKIVAPEYVSFALEFRKQIADENIVQLDWKAETPSVVSNTLEFTTTEGWRLLSSFDWSPNDQAEALKTVLVKNIGERRKDLEYIDLRIKNRIFYKFKNNSEENSVAPDKNSQTDTKSSGSTKS